MVGLATPDMSAGSDRIRSDLFERFANEVRHLNRILSDPSSSQDEQRRAIDAYHKFIGANEEALLLFQDRVVCVDDVQMRRIQQERDAVRERARARADLVDRGIDNTIYVSQKTAEVVFGVSAGLVVGAAFGLGRAVKGAIGRLLFGPPKKK